MRILNWTDWNGNDLRHLIARTMRETGDSPKDNYCFKIKQINYKGDDEGDKYKGTAWDDEKLIRMIVTPPDKSENGFNSEVFAQILIHELGHCHGLDHKDMVDWWGVEVPWARNYRVRSKHTAGNGKRVHNNKMVPQLEAESIMYASKPQDRGNTQS